jgi:hypothetical protein
MKRFARTTGLLLALTMLPLSGLSLGCYCVDGFESYATDLTDASIDAGAPALVPLTVSVPGPLASAGVGIEVHVTDCRAGELMLNTRLLHSDGSTAATELASVFPASGATGSRTLSCPGAPARFALAPSELSCSGDRCSVDLRVELSSSTGVGPREVEVRLVKFDPGSCRHTDTLRDDGRIERWGN